MRKSAWAEHAPKENIRIADVRVKKIFFFPGIVIACFILNSI
jgi:hypothetical protein